MVCFSIPLPDINYSQFVTPKSLSSKRISFSQLMTLEDLCRENSEFCNSDISQSSTPTHLDDYTFNDFLIDAVVGVFLVSGTLGLFYGACRLLEFYGIIQRNIP